MKKALTLAILFALIIAIVPAEASYPLEVTIFSPMGHNGPEGLSIGTFDASGSAVEAELFCTDGNVTDLYRRLSEGQSGQLLRFMVYKKLDCSDGSGAIYLALKGLFDVTTGEVKSEWVILRGTGDYTRLKGEGSMTHTDGPLDPDIAAYDLYTGRMHKD